MKKGIVVAGSLAQDVVKKWCMRQHGRTMGATTNTRTELRLARTAALFAD